MPGKYYYAPVDSGRGAIGTGIIAGIQQGIGNFMQGRDNARRQKRQDQQDEQAAEDRSLSLAEHGWRDGQAPTRKSTQILSADSILPDMQEADVASVDDHGIGVHSRPRGTGIGLHLNSPDQVEHPVGAMQQQDPQFGTGWMKPELKSHAPTSYDIEERDPDYMQVGNRFHLTPEAEQSRADTHAAALDESRYQLGRSRKQGEDVDARAVKEHDRQNMENTIADALLEEHPDWSKTKIRAQAHVASMDEALLKEMVGPDHASETLTETKRHNKAMEGVAGQREQRLRDTPKKTTVKPDPTIPGQASQQTRRLVNQYGSAATALEHVESMRRTGNLNAYGAAVYNELAAQAAHDAKVADDEGVDGEVTPPAAAPKAGGKSAGQLDWEKKHNQPAPTSHGGSARQQEWDSLNSEMHAAGMSPSEIMSKIGTRPSGE